MTDSTHNFIAGKKTAADWHELRGCLASGQANDWQRAFQDFYENRLSLRYLEPIRVLQEYCSYQGEGFSIVAIQCSLIEFLESTEQGTHYRYARRETLLGDHEYSSSKSVFVSFLTTRRPFSLTFDKASATDFYENVRCGLLHEARTKNGWKIWAKSPNGVMASTSSRIIYRDQFQIALLKYIEEYGKRLLESEALQKAFIRKFDALCQ